MYTGLNRNNSYFDKETVEKNIYSIFNIPIVGEYLKEVDNFGGHGGTIEIQDGEAKWVHTTKPYGCVPESATIYWEEVTEDDGSVNEYLIIDDALLWTGRYPEVEQLIRQEFNQSMEIEINKGKFKRINGQDVYVVDDFVFSALCILGIDKDSDPDGNVEPCFESASIIAYTLDKEDFKEEYRAMLDEIRKLNLELASDLEGEKIKMQGGSQVDEILAMLESYGLTLEDLQAGGINHEDYSLEELEELVKEKFASVDDPNNNVDNDDKQTDESSTNPEAGATDYSLTVSQLQEEVYRALEGFGVIVDEYWGFEYPKYSLVDIDTDNNVVVAFDNEKWYLVGFSYGLEGDKVVIDQESMKRFKISYKPMDIEDDANGVFEVVQQNFEKVKALYKDKEAKYQAKQEELEELNNKFTSLEEEYAKVSSEYAEKLKREREEAVQEIFATFSKELTEEEMAEVKAQKDDLELDEIKVRLFALVGQKKAKFNFSAGSKSKIINLEDAEPKHSNSSGKSYDSLFEQYGGLNKDED